MIRINLLPFRAARKKENVRRQISVFVLTLIFVSGLLYLGGAFPKRIIKKLNEDIKSTNNKLEKVTAAANEVNRIKKDLEGLEKKTQVIYNLKKSRREPVQMLDAMSGLVVEKRMWFTSFSDSGKTVKIKGIALDNKTVADFGSRLEKSGLFSKVTINNTKQQTFKNSLDLQSFEITCSKAEATSASDEKAVSS